MGQSLRSLDLSPQVDTSLDLLLDHRMTFWSNRFNRCLEAGAPEMVVALTKMVDCVEDPQTQAAFRMVNAQFVSGVLEEIEPFITGVNSGLDMGCGPGLFYLPLMDKIPLLYGIDLVRETIHYVRMQIRAKVGQDDCPHMHRVRACAAHELGQHSPEGAFQLRDLDRVFMFRAALHWPTHECEEAMMIAVDLLKNGGMVIMSELFLDDIRALIPGRKINPGTYYRTVEEYHRMLPDTTIVHRSGIHYNDTDPCRVVVFQKH